MLTAAPDFMCSISKMAGGTASITEPPTFLRLLVYMTIPRKLYFYITYNPQTDKHSAGCTQGNRMKAITIWNYGINF